MKYVTKVAMLATILTYLHSALNNSFNVVFDVLLSMVSFNINIKG